MRKESFSEPPRTMMELYRCLPEGTLAELIEGQIYMSPSPTSKHQRILNKINVSIYTHFKKTPIGEIFIAPFDVYLDETSNAVQPDIVIVLTQNKKIIDDNGHIHGSPDVLIEILSPGTRDFDLIRKKNLYEKYGVKEYWTVDPETKRCWGYTLRNNVYSPLLESSPYIKSNLIELTIDL